MNIFKNVLIGLGCIILVALLVFAYGVTLVNAADIDNAQYYATVSITNNGTVINGGAIVSMASISTVLISNFSVTSDRIIVHDSSGSSVPFMPGFGSNAWIFWVDVINASTTISDVIYTGNETWDNSIAYFPDAGGMTIVDSVTLEAISNNYTYSFYGYIDTSVSVNFTQKTQVIALKGGSDNITLEINGNNVLSKAASTGEHTVTVIQDGTNLWMTIDGAATANISALGWNDNAQQWIIAPNTITPYMYSANFTAGGDLKGSWTWQYATTFTDLSGNGNTATPTFRTASSDPDLSSVMTAFTPMVEAESTISGNATWPTMVASAPDQPDAAYTTNTSPGLFFAGPINDALDAATFIPRSFFWHNFAFFIIIVAGILVFRMNPSLLIKSITMAVLMILFAIEGVNVYGMFTVIYFAMFCAGMLILSKSYGW